MTIAKAMGASNECVRFKSTWLSIAIALASQKPILRSSVNKCVRATAAQLSIVNHTSSDKYLFNISTGKITMMLQCLQKTGVFYSNLHRNLFFIRLYILVIIWLWRSTTVIFPSGKNPLTDCKFIEYSRIKPEMSQISHLSSETQ